MLNTFCARPSARGLRAFSLLMGLSSLPACGGGSTGPGGGDPGASGTINVQISGEELATDGFRFPDGSEVTIVDGWEIQFSHVLLTIGKLRVSDNPDMSPSDQSQTGDVLAQIDGPWAVDLHREGSVAAAGGEGTATPLITIEKLNKKGDTELVAGERYAFSFDFEAASDGAEIVNFGDDDEAKALYAEAASNGYAVYYVGVATFKGSGCETSDDSYDFTKIPDKVDFKLGFATPTSYLNCQNQDNQGDPFEGEEYQRGLLIKENQASVAQITVHVDHPFYSATQHEPRLYFDQLAALLVGKPGGSALTLEDAAGVDPSAFEDAAGTALPWRVCDGSDLPAAKQRSFDTGSVPLDPKANPAKALRDYRDFVHYVQSAQGHMNGGEGLCFAKRSYPSPP
jgi:hypothetical protein